MSEPTPASTGPAPSEARLRAEARKAKIQARGGERLARLASTARGEEGAKLYDTTPPPLRTKSSSQSLATTNNNVASNAGTPQYPTPSTAHQQAFFDSMFPPNASSSSEPTSPSDLNSDPFSALLRSMQDPSAAGGGMGGGGFPGMPDGAGGMGQSLFPPGMMPPGMAPLEQEYSKKKTFADRMFTIAHLVGVLGLVMFVVGWWEPRVLERRSRGVIGHGEGLGGRVGTAWGGEGLGVELPVFWAFVTLSLILQTTRLLLFRFRPPPSALLSLISPFLPFIPPNLKAYIFTASRYISMLTQFFQDLCVLVFAVGVARWVQGNTLRSGRVGVESRVEKGI